MVTDSTPVAGMVVSSITVPASTVSGPQIRSLPSYSSTTASTPESLLSTEKVAESPSGLHTWLTVSTGSNGSGSQSKSWGSVKPSKDWSGSSVSSAVHSMLHEASSGRERIISLMTPASTW